VATGAVPPEVCGALNVTMTALPSGDWLFVLAGHAMVSAAGGGVGWVGLLHDIASAAATSTPAAALARGELVEPRVAASSVDRLRSFDRLGMRDRQSNGRRRLLKGNLHPAPERTDVA